jgi:LuxR family maltose regulon positive regulatory protein
VSTPLLSTKLYIPSTRPNLVPRPRLIQKLNAGLHCKVTLISAPAGYGKTTLISDWIEQSGLSFCWITLDDSDNDIGHFLAYFIASLRSINIDLDEQILTLIHSPQQNQLENILIPMINQIADTQKNFSLVLDDYHLIHSQDIHDAIAFLIEHSPPSMRLVLITRADPPLPLARLRARGQITEIRESDLRFSVEEGEYFLNHIQGLKLSSENIEVLVTRTDGWVAALQMVSIALKDRQEPTAYIQAVSGSQDYIADFLSFEVINQQSEDITDFLLKTSILDRLSGPLCDAITGGKNGSHILRKLRDENLFLTSLDDESHWFRYHRLFADLLQQQLLEIMPDDVPTLYLKASKWSEENELYTQATDYAIRGDHIQRAANLIGKNAEQTIIRSEIATFIHWVKKLPDEIIYEKDSLCIYYAWALLVSAEEHHIAEMYLNQVIPRDKQASGRLNAVKSMLFFFERQIPEAIMLARQSLTQLPEGDLFFRQIAAWNLSALLFINGESEEGAKLLEEVARISLASNNLLVATIALCRLGSIQIQQGNLNQAQGLFERALQIRPDNQNQPLPAACEAMLGLGKVSWERYELDTASKHLLNGIELSKRWREITDIDSYVTLAFIKQSLGDEDGALQMIKKAQKLALKTVTTDTDNKYVESQEAFLFLRQGNLQAVEHWATTRGLEEILLEKELVETGNLGVDVILRYELIVFARFLIAKKRFDEALNLLEKLLPSLNRLGHQSKIFEIQILISIGLYAQGKIDKAVSSINSVLAAAEQEEFRRIFFDGGVLLSDLINESVSQGNETQFAKQLLDTLKSKREDSQLEKGTSLIEPLSEREIEVLRLLNSDLPANEIADHLHIAVSTVRTHIKNIYSKLGVHSRFEAVSRARDLQLI